MLFTQRMDRRATRTELRIAEKEEAQRNKVQNFPRLGLRFAYEKKS